MEFVEWVARLVPGLVGAVFFIIAFDWLQTRSLNARRRPRESDERVTDEIAVPATQLYLAGPETCADLGWQIHAADDPHYTLWAINRTPHPGLRNVAVIIQMTP